MSSAELDDDDCDHLDAEFDVLTGRLICDCGYSKWLTAEQCKARIEFEQRAQANWDAYVAEIEAKGGASD